MNIINAIAKFVILLLRVFPISHPTQRHTNVYIVFILLCNDFPHNYKHNHSVI